MAAGAGSSTADDKKYSLPDFSRAHHHLRYHAASHLPGIGACLSLIAAIGYSDLPISLHAA